MGCCADGGSRGSRDFAAADHGRGDWFSEGFAGGLERAEDGPDVEGLVVAVIIIVVVVVAGLGAFVARAGDGCGEEVKGALGADAWWLLVNGTGWVRVR